MSVEEKVDAGKSAKDVFSFALHEAEGLSKEISKHFWTRLGTMINSKLKDATEAPEPKAITDDQARNLGKLVIPKGKHKGKTLNDIPIDYLEWVADNWTCQIGEAVRKYIESPGVRAERR